MTAGDYIRSHVWVPLVIGLGGAATLLILFVAIYCGYRCYRRCRHGHPYVTLRGRPPVDVDSVSYGSLTLESNRQDRQNRYDRQDWQDRQDRQDKGSAPPTEAIAPPIEAGAPPTKAGAPPTKAGASPTGQASKGQSIQRQGSEQPQLAPLSARWEGGGAGGGREVGVFWAMEQQRRSQEISEREAAVLACQFHLRSTNRHYTLQQTLPDMGSRMQKYWFLVTPASPASATQLLLTTAPVSKQCPIKLQGSSLRTLNELLAALKHPSLFPITEVDYIPDKHSVMVIQPLAQQGSLKDLIYKSEPVADWSVKYSVRKKGLPLETIALYGRQLLEILQLLYRKGFPAIGHLHSGNVMVTEKTCRLSGYENLLLGYKTRHYKLLREHVESIDVIMFGHLLFEMSFGHELTDLQPDKSELQTLQHQPLLEVFNFIFWNDSESFPSIQEVQGLSFFQQVQLPTPKGKDQDKLHLTSEMKALLKAVRQGRPASQLRQVQPKRRSQAGSEHEEARYPVTPLRPAVSAEASGSRATTTNSTVSAKSRVRFAPPAPSAPAATLPPPAKSAPPPKTQNRSALLSDIHKGKKLMKAVTNDRSAPKI